MIEFERLLAAGERGRYTAYSSSNMFCDIIGEAVYVMTTNTELEERWIEAWNDLFDIVGERWKVNCLLPNGSIVDIETCKGWLQDSAYEDYCLKVEEGWVIGERGVVVSRFKADDRSIIPEH